MKLDFLSWLQETATSTADVAGFSMPLFSGPISRPSLLSVDDKDEDKHKKKKKHHKKKKNEWYLKEGIDSLHSVNRELWNKIHDAVEDSAEKTQDSLQMFNLSLRQLSDDILDSKPDVRSNMRVYIAESIFDYFLNIFSEKEKGVKQQNVYSDVMKHCSDLLLKLSNNERQILLKSVQSKIGFNDKHFGYHPNEQRPQKINFKNWQDDERRDKEGEDWKNQ